MRCLKLATSRTGLQFPCGQCRNCRINRKREWQARLLLEAATSRFSMFVTLTLEVKADGPYETFLSKRDVQNWLKRLRKAVAPISVRYLAVGEYGERAGRAHYHALVFCSAPVSESVVSAAWGLGHVDFGDVQPESIDYVLDYILKRSGDTTHLGLEQLLRRERYPEFRLFSQGLGRAALLDLCHPDPDSGELILRREFRVLGRTWPVSRYFKTKMRSGESGVSLRLAGVSDPVAESSEEAIERALCEELRSLPAGSEAFKAAREAIIARRKAVTEKLIAKNCRDYYRDLHKLTDRGRKNETF